MEFALSDDQKMLQDSISGTLANISDLDTIRDVAAGKTNANGISAGLAELGTTQLLIPEPYDGLGLSALDAALVQEALGAYISPAAFAVNAALAVTAIREAATDAQQADWLPKIASGEMKIAIALSERIGKREGAGVTANDGKLNSKALFALGVPASTHVITADPSGALYLTPLNGAVSVTLLQTIDRTRKFAELIFDNAQAEALTGEAVPGNAADRTIALGRILLAADTLGAAQAMLDKAVEYAKQRKQFGRVIGSFQAVKHMCAEMAARLEPCRALVWHAAYLFDAEPERAALMACHAKAHTSEVGTFVARTATEVYGGMGFTDLVGLHYWFKRIGVNRQLLGGPEVLRSEAARLQGF